MHRTSSYAEGSNAEPLLKRRDRLLARFRKAGASGIISAGIGQAGGKPILVLLVRPWFEGAVPHDIEGTPVLVRKMRPAAA
jgi:hypothetical protein